MNEIIATGIGYSHLYKLLREKDEEIKRLKGLIEDAYNSGYADYDVVAAKKVKNNWSLFKAEHDL